jgi:hypothetical protein
MDTRDIVIPLTTVNEIIAAVVPYDMVSYIYPVIYRASNGEEMTLGKMFDTLAFHTRGDIQHGPIFDRIVGHIAGLRIADYSELVTLTKEMLPHS